MGESGLNERRFNALVRFNDRNRRRYFSVGYRSLTFESYVGVLQVGDLIIEILPKTDSNSDTERWHDALVEILRRCGLVRIDRLPKALQNARSATLIDIYLWSFVEEARAIVSSGLIKKYRRRVEIRNTLKGKVLHHKQARDQILHKERFVTEHTDYTVNNRWNAIIKAGLTISLSLTSNGDLASAARRVLADLAPVADLPIRKQDFDRLIYDRNTEAYRDAISLARLIVLNYSPDLSGGHDAVLGILFNMDQLFERFVFLELRRAANSADESPVKVEAQHGERFWATRRIRPDIILSKNGEQPRRIIIDTKWKILTDNSPSDEDLRQVYAYNLHFGARTGYLIYPFVGVRPHEPVDFVPPQNYPEITNACGVYFVRLFDDDGLLRKDIGSSILDEVMP